MNQIDELLQKETQEVVEKKSGLDLTAENQLIADKVAEMGENIDHFEVASRMFGLYTPHLEKLLKTLSTGDLRRLVNGLVQYPLNDKEFINDGKNLRDAFHVGQSLLEAKMVMIQHAMVEQYKKAMELEKTSPPTDSL